MPKKAARTVSVSGFELKKQYQFKFYALNQDQYCRRKSARTQARTGVLQKDKQKSSAQIKPDSNAEATDENTLRCVLSERICE